MITFQVTERCRSVLCPSGQIYNSEGTCVFVVTAWYDSYVMVHLQLTSDVLLNMTNITMNNFASPWPEDWRLDVLYYFPIDDSQPNMTNKIIAHIVCKFKIVYPSILIKQIGNMKNNAWTVEIGSSKMRLEADFMHARDHYKMFLIYEYLPALKRNRTVIYSRKTRNRPAIVDRMNYCWQVEIKANEFKNTRAVVYNNITGKHLVPGEYYYSNLKGEKIVKVCLEDSGFNITGVTSGCLFSYMKTNVCCLILLMSLFYVFMIC